MPTSPEDRLEQLFLKTETLAGWGGDAARNVLITIYAARCVAEAAGLKLSDGELVTLAGLIRDEQQHFNEHYAQIRGKNRSK